MAIETSTKSVPVLFVLGGISAILFGWITGARNIAGLALAIWGTGLLVESLDRSHHLWHPEDRSFGKKPWKDNLTMAGVLAVSMVPALDFLALPALLPRTQGLQDAGLILCAAGFLFLLRSKISRECWVGEENPPGMIQREVNRKPIHTNRLLEFTGVVLWAMGICFGFGSLLGVLATLLLLAPGAIPQKVQG
jgi:hypothetical protein